MKTRIRSFMLLLLVCAILSACGPSQAEVDAASTQAAANDFATQTAQAPTATSTLVPTSTATFTPSPTIVPSATTVPSATPNLQLTSMAATAQAFQLTRQVEQTAEAASAQATQQVVDALWAQLVSDGSITGSWGEPLIADDFEESWAQLNWYRWWQLGYDLADFVLMTHIDWEYPEDAVDEGGCGFVFRIQDENNHLVVFLTTHNGVGLGAMTPNGWRDATVRWYTPNPVTVNQHNGGADFMVAAQGEIVTVYIDGVKTGQYYVARTSTGDIAYTILSGTNAGSGTTCSFTNTRIWELFR